LVTGIAVFALSALAVATLALKGWRDHRDLLELRGRMLDECAGLLAEARISIGSDSFPILTGRLGDGRVARVDLVADTLVVRRLPQLWMRLTIFDKAQRRAFSIGALARATGAEFYSIVAELPDRLDATCDLPLVVRGDRVPRQIERMGEPMLAHLFSDPRLKEVAATPGGLRVVRQVSEGDRASHLLLRQTRFGVDAVSCGILKLAIEDAVTFERGTVEEERTNEPA